MPSLFKSAAARVSPDGQTVHNILDKVTRSSWTTLSGIFDFDRSCQSVTTESGFVQLAHDHSVDLTDKVLPKKAWGKSCVECGHFFW